MTSSGTLKMDDFSLYLLDILQNSIAVKASKIELSIIEKKHLFVEIKDNGSGMSKESLRKALSPFYTTRTTRNVGLGLPMIKMLCEQTNGSFTIDSMQNIGTTINMKFNHKHIDMPPIGDLGDMVYMISAHQDIKEFIFTYQYYKTKYCYVLSKVKKILGNDLNNYQTMKGLTKIVNHEINKIRGGL